MFSAKGKGAAMTVKDINSLTKEQLIEQYVTDQKLMFEKIEELNKRIAELENQHQKDEIELQDMELRYKVLNEKYMQVISAKYQSQKNKIVVDMPTLFDDVEEEALKIEEAENEEVITVSEHKRVHKKPKEKHIDYSSLEHRYVTLDIPEGEDICDKCGSKMKLKGYTETEKLMFIKPQVYVEVTRIPVLECEQCQSDNPEGRSTYKTVSHPKPLIEKSKVSASLLAYIIDMKYNNGLPLYTIEKMFERDGVLIPRANMSNWIISMSKYLTPLYDLMKKDLLSKKYIQADETTTQVLREDGKLATSTSYMFVYRTIKYDEGIVLYDYRASRSGDGPKEYLNGYSPILITDAYSGYDKVEGAIRAMCNVHALRKFKDAYKLLANTKKRKDSYEAKAIAKYDAIFHMDHEIEEKALKKNLTGDERIKFITEQRKRKIKPMFDEFLSWLEEIRNETIHGYQMTSAINYTLNNKVELTRFIDDGYIPMDNSACERSIRPFVVIRNRCKFYVSTRGATISAIIYSLVITCIENNINPYMYFYHIFETLPNIDTKDTLELRKLLPYSKELPKSTKTLTKSEIRKILEEAGER